jgi:RES domain-containing protein
MVYTSGTLSLAALEYLVHLDKEDAPEDLCSLSADIPDDVRQRIVALSELPSDWRAYPAPEKLAELGLDWLQSLETAVLVVPSAVIPEEKNYLINPMHREASKITPVQKVPFSFDLRVRHRRSPRA